MKKLSKEFMQPLNGRIRSGKEQMKKEVGIKVDKTSLLSLELQCIYYVYKCFVDDELRYIGMGKGSRIDHCTSGKTMRVEKVKDKLTQYDAFTLETDLIWENEDKGIYNKIKNVNMASQPNISKVKGMVVAKNQSSEALFKQIAKVSPDITEYNFENFAYWLHKCDLNMYIVDVGSTKALVLDKPFREPFNYLHLGCPNFPNCDLVGCYG